MHHDQQGTAKHPFAPAGKGGRAQAPRRSSVKASLPPALIHPPAHQRARSATLPSSKADSGDWRKPRQLAEAPALSYAAKAFPSTVQISLPIQIAGLADVHGFSSLGTDDKRDKDDHARLVLPPPGIRGPAKLVLNVEALTSPQTAIVISREPERMEEHGRHRRVDSAASVSSIHSAKLASAMEERGATRGHHARSSTDSKPPVLGLDTDASTASEKHAKHPLYKTEMCRTWEETGHCRYGTKCQFAHGEPELRRLTRHPKYKTEICRTFWERGECPYGKRCCFIHHSRKTEGMDKFMEQLQHKDKSAAGTPSENTTPVLPATPVSPVFNLTFNEGEHSHELVEPLEKHPDDYWHVLTPPMQPATYSSVHPDTFDTLGMHPRAASPPQQPEGQRTRTISDGFAPFTRPDEKKRLPVFKNFS